MWHSNTEWVSPIFTQDWSQAEDNIEILKVHVIFYNNSNDFFCTNILEDQAQWRDKTKGLSKLVMVKQRMDEEARRLRRIGSIKEIGF